MSANHGAIINHVHKSQKNFWVYYENTFLVLPDGKTIIGPEGGNRNNLICEDITKSTPSAYALIAKHGGGIDCVFYNAILKSIFAGDRTNVVIEYQKKNKNLSWSQTKNYGNLKIGNIKSFEQIGDILIIGGFNSYCIRAIDTNKKVLLPGKIETAIHNVYSLQKCELPMDKVYLSICGGTPKYSKSQTNIYDATNLAKAFSYQFSFKNNSSTFFISDIKSIPVTHPERKDLCGCDSRKIINTLITKFEHYLQVFAGTLFNHFNQSLMSVLRNYFYINKLLKKHYK
jgi:hypothetical protein